MKRLLHLVLLVIVLGITLGLAAQEEAGVDPTIINPTKFCKKPFHLNAITLTVPPPTAATPNPNDFPACSTEPGFGIHPNEQNKCFKHTFTWKGPKGCLCSSGTLTIQYAANSTGPHAADNDTIAFYSGGSVVPGTSQALYSGGAVVGQVLTKAIPVSCTLLANNSLSFLVQDDTSVVSAKLTVRYCCPPCPLGQTEETFPGTHTKYCCEGKPGDPRFCCTAEKEPGGR